MTDKKTQTEIRKELLQALAQGRKHRDIQKVI